MNWILSNLERVGPTECDSVGTLRKRCEPLRVSHRDEAGESVMDRRRHHGTPSAIPPRNDHSSSAIAELRYLLDDATIDIQQQQQQVPHHRRRSGPAAQPPSTSVRRTTSRPSDEIAVPLPCPSECPELLTESELFRTVQISVRELEKRCSSNKKYYETMIQEAADAKAKLSIVESKLKSLEREMQCSICYDRPRDCVLLPCTYRANHTFLPHRELNFPSL